MKNKITPIGKNKLHSDYKTWENYLQNYCQLVDTYKGTFYYQKSNCNYILLPNKHLITNYAYHGINVMREIKEKKWKFVFNKIQRIQKEIQSLLNS